MSETSTSTDVVGKLDEPRPATDAPASPAARLLTRIRPGWGAVVVVLAAVITVLYANHIIFPDTQYYLGWTYRLMGYGKVESSHMVYDFMLAGHHMEKPYGDILWEWPYGWLNTRPRMALPVLSIPFVWAFGGYGIVVVPTIFFVASMYLIYRLARTHTSIPASVIACMLPLLGAPLVMFSVGGLTDSLALFFHAALLAMLPWRKDVTWQRGLAIVAIVAVSATARFSAPFTIAAMIGLWLWSRRNDRDRRRAWTLATVAAGVGTGLAFLWTRYWTSPISFQLQLDAVVTPKLHPGQSVIAWYFQDFPTMMGEELTSIYADPAQRVLLTASLIACVVGWRTIIPWLVIPAWIGGLGVQLINPYISGIRYELPMVPVLVLALAYLIDRAFGSPLAQRYFPRTKAAPPAELAGTNLAT